MNTQPTPTGVKLMLPFPDSILNPNVTGHWATKQPAKKAAREAAYILAYNLQIKLDSQKKYRVTLIFCPPDRRYRDLDNMVSSMKSALDGMCRALGINDKNIKPEPDWGPGFVGGKVEVTITELVLDSE